jgi:hypothetical protein
MPLETLSVRHRLPFFAADERGVSQQFLQVEFVQLNVFFQQQGLDVPKDLRAGQFVDSLPIGAAGGRNNR